MFILINILTTYIEVSLLVFLLNVHQGELYPSLLRYPNEFQFLNTTTTLY